MLNCVRRSIKYLNRIKIPDDFLSRPPKSEKIIQKTADFLKGDPLHPIYVDKEFNLIDGYCSYLIATTLNTKKVKIIQVRQRKDNG